MIDHKERNAEIARRYAAGDAPWDLCREFKLTRGRIYQILREAGATRMRQVKSGRDNFLGVNLSGPVKDALKAEADRRGISMSALSSESLKEMLVSCGYPLEAEKVSL